MKNPKVQEQTPVMSDVKAFAIMAAAAAVGVVAFVLGVMASQRFN